MSGIKWYPGQHEKLQRDVQMALEMTAEAVRTDLVQSQTVPFADASKIPTAGELQGSIFVDRKDSARGRVAVVANTPYARRLYYHPEYHFYRGTNPQAGGMWFEPYINGRKRDFPRRAYEKLLKGLRG